MLEGKTSLLKLLLKIFGTIWLVAFSLYVILLFWSGWGHSIPAQYREFYYYFSIFLDLIQKSLIVNLTIGTIILCGVFKQENDFKFESGWGNLSEKFLLSRARLKGMKLDFLSGKAVVGDLTHYGIHVAGSQSGLILKFPFPYSLLQPTLFIPWTEITNIVLRKHPYFEMKKSVTHKFRELFGSYKYAEINLKSFPEQKLIIPWKKNMKEFQYQKIGHYIGNR